MAGTVDDLEAAIKKRIAAEPDEAEFEDDGIEDLQRADMQESIGLLKKSLHLMSYIADKDLCKGLTKRERASMFWMTEQIREFLDDVEDHYEDDDDVENSD